MSDDFDLMREIRRRGSAFIDSSGNVTFTRGPLHWTDQMRDDRAKLIAYARELEGQIRHMGKYYGFDADGLIDEHRDQCGVADLLQEATSA